MSQKFSKLLIAASYFIISILTEIFSELAQHCARLCKVVQLSQVDKLTTKPAMYRNLESDKFTFSSLASQAAFILGNFVHLYKAYLHFLNILEQY